VLLLEYGFDTYLTIIDADTLTPVGAISYTAYVNAFTTPEQRTQFALDHVPDGSEPSMPATPSTKFGVWTNNTLTLAAGPGLALFDVDPTRPDWGLTPRAYLPLAAGPDTQHSINTGTIEQLDDTTIAVFTTTTDLSRLSNNAPPDRATPEQIRAHQDAQAAQFRNATSAGWVVCDVDRGSCTRDRALTDEHFSAVVNHSR
jgi:hypothetical protein